MKLKYPIAAAIILLACSFIPQAKDKQAGQEDGPIKAKALGILEAKCNTCHSVQNPARVFTRDNMDSYAGPIYRQVFVWHRMPKNNAAVLSTVEQEALKRWLRNYTKVKE
jgi:uncharacterized membrane protein